MTNTAIMASPAMAQLMAAAAAGNVALDGVPEHLYHAFPAMSATGLKEFRKGPGYFKYWREHPSEDTQARLAGRLVHMALNEPARFAMSVCAVEGHRGKTEVKAEIAAWVAAGKIVCKPADKRMAEEVASYCRKHPRIAELLESGVGERVLLWKDPTTGAQCKARVDWIATEAVLADWKSFDKVWDDDELERQIRNMAYQFQAAWYLEGFYRVYKRRAKGFYNVFIRIDEPYDAAVREICQHSVEEAIPHIERALVSYAECVRTNHWPMTAPEVGAIEVRPFWN